MNNHRDHSIDQAIVANDLAGDHIAKLLLMLDAAGKQNPSLEHAASLVDRIDQILATLNYADFKLTEGSIKADTRGRRTNG